MKNKDTDNKKKSADIDVITQNLTENDKKTAEEDVLIEQNPLKLERQAEIRRIEKEKRAKRNKKAIVITVSSVAVILILTVLNFIVIPNSYYKKGESLLSAGDYAGAVEAFEVADDYSDAQKQKEKAIALLKCSTIKVGDTLLFGTYQKDNNTANGRKPIEWRVLAVDGTRFLLISEYVLDCHLYNSVSADVSWETCTLRAWLNDDFFKRAFSLEEQSAVVLSLLSNPDNYKTGALGCYDTYDKVFCLSIQEAEQYFSKESDMRAKYTNYALSRQKAYVKINDGYGPWWLRSPGANSLFVANVTCYGNIDSERADSNHSAVRPAIWLDMASDFFTSVAP